MFLQCSCLDQEIVIVFAGGPSPARSLGWTGPYPGRQNMVARVRTVAFQGIEAVPVDVQVMIAPGKVGIQIVGLPDKAVAESRERVQAALHASGLSMPS